ncbi:MAG: FtsX-like permease family protein [Gammaproteobacteria bacterium]|nr:FtsX-like permease family protein [Gammaproteobacteria bacterium]
MNPLVLASRQLRREWRSGELAILVIALVIAVGALSSVSFFTDRVRTAVERRATESLAADLVVQSRQAFPPEFRARAESAGLEVALTRTFASVVTTENAAQLSEIRGAEAGYPLRGKLRITERAFATASETDALPPPGTVWVEPRLLAALGVEVGDTVRVGKQDFTVDKVLEYTPDQGFSFVEIAPMLLMRAEELDSTELIGPASRVTHRLLMAGEREAIDELRDFIEPQLGARERLLDIKDGRPELVNAIDRADRFLNLAALVSVLLAGIAIAMAARRYTSRETDTVAILKCLGLPRRTVLLSYLSQLLLLALLAGFAGLLLGYGAQLVLVELLRDFVGQDLPPASLDPAPWALGLGIIILAGFGMPPVLGLAGTTPMRVLRRDVGAAPLSGWLVYGIALAAIVAILLIETNDTKLSAYVLGGTAAGAVLLASGAALLVWLLGRARSGVGVAWRFGIASIVRRGRDSVIQSVAFGLGMMVLLLLAVVRTDLLASWQAMLPENAPNFFMINIQPDERAGVSEFFDDEGIEPPSFSALVRARLTHINGEAITDIDFGSERARGFAEREANLTMLDTLPDSNTVVAGEWWPADSTGALVSFEEEAAERLGLALGDEVSYNIAGEEITATIASLRRIDWDSFQPNFFMAFPPGFLEVYPATYISSIYVPERKSNAMVRLLREFPSVTVIDLDAILTQVRDVMDQAALAVEYVFLFTLLAGVLVLLAAVQASRDERRFESAILRTLGATRQNVMAGVIAEFTLLGLLSAVLATVVAFVAGWALATQIFELDYQPGWGLWLIGLIAGTLWVSATGVLATRRVVRQPPLMTLRRR